jgi:hypothetical protein
MMRRDLVLPPDRQELKNKSRDLVRAFGGSDAAGVATGKRQQTISDATLRNTDRYLTIEDVAVLEDATAGLAGHPIITRALAQRQGFALVELPTAPPEGSDLLLLLAALHQQFGGMSQGLCEALADVIVTADEAGALRRRFSRELIDVAVKLDAALAAIEGAG